MREYRYPWPASAIGTDEMRLLYAEREGSEDHRPITKLIRDAVRECYGAQNENTKGDIHETDINTQDFEAGPDGTAKDRAA